MSDDTPLPEADCVEGAPHPREALQLFGQDAAQAEFLDAFNRGRLHHAWLLSGPRGVGKATLAWRIARFLLAQPATSDAGLFGDAAPAPVTLDLDPEHPVARRVAALSEPGLFLLRRAADPKTGKLKTVIAVDEVRKMKNFFALSAADGGRRVVIIDSADEMNSSAANALLKLLEEPPENATLLLIAHQPARLLPTIRSRCRILRCAPLGADDMARALEQAGFADEAALGALTGGSVGEAVRMASHEGSALYAALVALMGSAPGLDRPGALKLADSAAGRGNEGRYDLLLRLLDILLARLSLAGVQGPAPEAAPGEAQMLSRLSPDASAARLWATQAQELGARIRHGRAVNLDPATLILDTVLKIDETAARLNAPGLKYS